MTEREQLEAMLSHAGNAGVPSEALFIQDKDNRLRVITGPDDAVATFEFDASGTLVSVDVAESGERW